MKGLKVARLIAAIAVIAIATSGLAQGPNKGSSGYVPIVPSLSTERIAFTVTDLVEAAGVGQGDQRRFRPTVVEHFLSTVHLDVAAELGLGGFLLDARGEYVLVVADSVRASYVPVDVVLLENPTVRVRAIAVVGVACRLKFVAKRAELEASYKTIGLEVKYRAESLSFGAYGFNKYRPFEIPLRNDQIDMVRARTKIVELFNSYNAEEAGGAGEDFSPMVLGFILSEPLDDAKRYKVEFRK